MTQHRRDAFTLIELAIVLVIIGLVVGGVLVGRDLVAAAQLRRTISQKERFEIAASAFKSKYGCIPGDCKGATLFGMYANGNEDGTVGGRLVYTENDEYKLFWRHLYDSGLVGDPLAAGNSLPANSLYGAGPSVAGYHSPACPICRTQAYTYGGVTVQMGGWGFQQLANVSATLDCGNPVTWTSLGGIIPTWSALLLMDGSVGLWGGGGVGGAVSPANAYGVDAKIDDGMPFSGSVIAFSPYSYSDPACSSYNGYPAISNYFAGTCFSGSNYNRGMTSQCLNMAFKANAGF